MMIVCLRQSFVVYSTKTRVLPHIPADSKSYGGYKVVENQIIPGYSLFDWCMVFEKDPSAVFMIV